MWPTKYAVISDLIYVLRSESSIVLFFGNVSIFANVRQWTYQKKIRPNSVELHTILQHSKNKCSPVCLWSRVKIEPKKKSVASKYEIEMKIHRGYIHAIPMGHLDVSYKYSSVNWNSHALHHIHKDIVRSGAHFLLFENSISPYLWNESDREREREPKHIWYAGVTWIWLI